MAKKVRRILKQGGVAVFINCVGRSQLFAQIENLNRSIGWEGRCREFQLTRRILVWEVKKEVEWKDGADLALLTVPAAFRSPGPSIHARHTGSWDPG